jgi:hypothetical protein
MIPSVFAYTYDGSSIPRACTGDALPGSPVCEMALGGGCILDRFTTDIRTDKETYQSGETVNFTVEIFNECVSKILAEGPSHEKYEMAGQHHDLKFMISEQGNQTVETVRIRVGEQKTFQFEPEIYTWTQEYQVNSAGQSGLGTGWNIKTLFNVLPAGGCGEGTVLVDGACQLTSTPKAKSSFMSIDPLYIIIGVVGIGGVIGAIAVAKRGSKTPKPAAKPKPAKQKPVEKKETSAFCENCGNTLNPKAKFCGSCGTRIA